MSRAFVKEPEGARAGDDQPELPRSSHPNYVTPAGLAALELRRQDLISEKTALDGRDSDLKAISRLSQVERELRYIEDRVASARVIDPLAQPSNEVAFGALVTLRDATGERHRYAIVGEDEAEPLEGKVSWVSPLARALTGATVGDIVTWRRPSGDRDLEVVAISYFRT